MFIRFNLFYMKKIALSLVAAICILLPYYSSGQTKLKRRTFLDGKVDLLVPVDFMQMSDDSVAKQFADPKHRPMIVLKGDNNRVSILIRPLSQDMRADSMGMVDYKMFLWGTLKSTHPDMQKLDDGVEKIHGKYVAFFKVANVEQVDKDIIYNFFTVVDDKVVLFTISCTAEVAPKWNDVMDKIRNSLRCI